MKKCPNGEDGQPSRAQISEQIANPLINRRYTLNWYSDQHDTCVVGEVIMSIEDPPLVVGDRRQACAGRAQ